MTEFEILACEPPLEIRVMPGAAGAGFDLPLGVPLEFAEHSGPNDILIWRNGDIAGLFQPRARLAWMRSRVGLANIAILRPDRGPGVVGLEIGLIGEEESPALASSCWSPEALAWFRGHAPVFERFFAQEVLETDYGFDR